MSKRFAHVTVIGQDKAGVIARICQFLFDCGGNIEELDQHVTQGLFTMHLEVSWPQSGHTESDMRKGLEQLGEELGMDILIRSGDGGKRDYRIGLLVTKEEHAPRAVLEACKTGDLPAEVAVVLSNKDTLEGLADEFDVEFQHIDDRDKPAHEEQMLGELAKHDVDLVVLARYMRILSPNFVWRYPNRIINIHPSLLPAFPGAVPYRQAYQKGVRVSGVTAHIVTMDLDQGPIIAQESFAVDPQDELPQIVQKGRRLEERVLLEGLRLYTQGRLEFGWGRAWVKE